MTRRELARALTRLESGELRESAPASARIIGVTGAPGAGKSTLVSSMIRQFRKLGLKVAVLAVDPSSPFTGGALLGDRIRMDCFEDEGVFIRSMASRNGLGGLAPATGAAARLLAQEGFDIVLVETVGVGQADVEVTRIASITLLVLTPNMGDDIQAGKAGILEAAGVLVLNKSDLPGADRAERHLREELEDTPLFRTVASSGEGVPALVDYLLGVG